MFAVMSAAMFAIVSGMNVVLSVTIIAMMNHTAEAIFDNETAVEVSECPDIGDTLKDGPFFWEEESRGFVLSSYFIGYIVTPIPGGIIAEKYSAKWLIFCAVLLNMIGCVCIPPLAKAFEWGSMVPLRIMQGAGGGVTFPAMHVMLSKWAPPAQRSIFAGIVYAGTPMGIVTSILLGGFASVAIGWEWVFYIMAMLCFPWLLLWAMWVHDSPRTAVFITHDERISILKAQQGERKEEAPQFPYKSVFSSTAFWAILVGHTGGSTGFSAIVSQTPSYLKIIQHIPMRTLTSLSAIPYIFMYLFSIVTGMVMDYFRKNNRITTRWARRVAAAIAMLIPAIMLIIIPNVGCDWMLAVSLVTVAGACVGAQSSAYIANHIDIAPNFAGILMGITNVPASFPGIAIPFAMGALTAHKDTIDRWAIVFYTVAAIEVTCFAFFAFFVQGSVQPWNAGRKWEKRQAARRKALADKEKNEKIKIKRGIKRNEKENGKEGK